MLFEIIGQAGVGKSFVLDCFKDLLGDQALVLAQSGKAAVNVKGSTIHSAFGFGQGDYAYGLSEMSPKTKKDKKINFNPIKYIFIDEISLVDKKLFAAAELRAREIKENDLLWGGINVVLLGDWSQMKPVKSYSLFHKELKTDNAMHKHGKKV